MLRTKKLHISCAIMQHFLPLCVVLGSTKNWEGVPRDGYSISEIGV